MIPRMMPSVTGAVGSFPTISGVSSVYQTETHDINIHTFVGAIKDGKWRPQIEEIRKVYADVLAVSGPVEAKKAANLLKEKLPAITVSGRFQCEERQWDRSSFRIALRRSGRSEWQSR
jgi:hypothetical protein